MSVGEAIRLIRRQAGHTQQQMADALEVGRASVQNWERGDYEPTLRMLARFRLCYDYCPYLLAALTDKSVSIVRHRELLRNRGGQEG